MLFSKWKGRSGAFFTTVHDIAAMMNKTEQKTMYLKRLSNQ